MTYAKLEHLRRVLLGRRYDLMARQRIAGRYERELVAEREPDWPDAAALDTAATVLDTLGQHERRAVGEIDAALDRMARGTYGTCGTCGDTIDGERLRAVPETKRCARCAPRAS
jgi:RNA polymerase-binding transcription factor DksA